MPNKLNSIIRMLDVNDLIILTMLGQGYRLTDIAKKMKVTRAAVTHRMYRYKKIWPSWDITKTKDMYILSKGTKRVCTKAFKILGYIGAKHWII